jgi:hypothetical protein
VPRQHVGLVHVHHNCLAVLLCAQCCCVLTDERPHTSVAARWLYRTDEALSTVDVAELVQPPQHRALRDANAQLEAKRGAQRGGRFVEVALLHRLQPSVDEQLSFERRLDRRVQRMRRVAFATVRRRRQTGQHTGGCE